MSENGVAAGHVSALSQPPPGNNHINYGVWTGIATIKKRFDQSITGLDKQLNSEYESICEEFKEAGTKARTRIKSWSKK
jgi:hypothetical protein